MTRKLSDHEIRLWRRVADTVKPYRSTVLTNEPTSSVELTTKPAARTLKGLGGQPSLRPVIAPSSLAQDHSGHRRVRRGQLAIDASLDLHGHTQTSGRQALQTFVLQHHALGARCLLVITGKGRAGGGLLRKRFLDWINEPDLRPSVAGYAPANARHGGEGAYYLLLKRAPAS